MDQCACQRNADGDVIDKDGLLVGEWPMYPPRCPQCSKEFPGEWNRGPFVMSTDTWFILPRLGFEIKGF